MRVSESGRALIDALKAQLENNPDLTMKRMCKNAGLTRSEALVLLLLADGAYAEWMDEDD